MDNEKVINRMIRELEQAKAKQTDPRSIRKHIENVQLLGSLFLEDEKTEVAEPTSFSEKEKEMMFGDLYKGKKATTQQKQSTDDDANGDSIFDF